MHEADPPAGAAQSFAEPPSAEDIEAMAARAFETIPAELRERCEGLLFRVEEFPDAEICEEFALESPFDLLGLYSGVDLTQKSVLDSGVMPDMVFLYRRPILDYWCETGEDLTHLVRHVLIHEIGHHFGLSDDDMEALEQAAEDSG